MSMCTFSYASAVADKCIELVENKKTDDFEALNALARVIKGLVELVKGDIKYRSSIVRGVPTNKEELLNGKE
uniref:Uncharacterized protein n=1 Tax=Medicago truncatula TaxID=3880 RepID=Q2HSX0_MEDTR|nr:hypothetical protein MtrDRAFT_AC150891g55v2 [Medicago truncatula]